MVLWPLGHLRFRIHVAVHRVDLLAARGELLSHDETLPRISLGAAPKAAPKLLYV